MNLTNLKRRIPLDDHRKLTLDHFTKQEKAYFLGKYKLPIIKEIPINIPMQKHFTFLKTKANLYQFIQRTLTMIFLWKEIAK